MTRRSRLALRLAACALAGVVLTVAVAWAAHILFFRVGHSRVYPLRNPRWPIAVPRGWQASPEAGSRLHYPMQDETTYWFVVNVGGIDMARSVDRMEAGIPARSLQSSWVLNGAGVGPVGFLPLRPLWPGFALDTLFYGGLVFLLWSAPGVIRRRVRKRRGRCLVCGYDLRGSPAGKCPECGVQREGLEEREEGLIHSPS